MAGSKKPFIETKRCIRENLDAWGMRFRAGRGEHSNVKSDHWHRAYA